MNWFQLFFKRKISLVIKKKKSTLVPALGTNFERSTELTGMLQSSGDRMKTGVPELKYQNDYGNNMLTLRRPACQSHQRLELSCKPCCQTEKAMLISFKGISQDRGKQAKHVLFLGHIMCPLLITWLHRAEAKRNKYENISQSF